MKKINGHEFIYKETVKLKLNLYKCKNCNLEGFISIIHNHNHKNNLCFFNIDTSRPGWESKPGWENIYSLNSCDEMIIMDIIY